MPPLFCNE